jgi:hypothetical protein
MEQYRTLFNTRLDYLYTIVNQMNSEDTLTEAKSLRKEYLYVITQLLDINEMINRELKRVSERTKKQLDNLSGS